MRDQSSGAEIGTELSRLSRKFLHREAADRVRGFIRDRALWGRFLPPERDLARLFGISRGTLRKGLNLIEAEGLISRRQGQGTMVLARNETRTATGLAHVAVALVGSSQARGYYGDLMAGLAEGTGNADWIVSFFSDLGKREKRRALLEVLPQRGIDGLILQSMTNREMVSEILERWSGPTVLVDHFFEGLPLTCVVDDSRQAGRLAGEHLVSLGHRRIAYIDASRPAINPWRREGFAAALAAGGLALDEDLVLCCHADEEQGAAAARKLLGRSDPPTAIAVFDHNRAKGAWQAAEELGLHVGRHVALVSFGDSLASADVVPGLSAVEFSARQMGITATRELDELMTGGAEPGRLVEVPVRLVVRESSREARGSNQGSEGTEEKP